MSKMSALPNPAYMLRFLLHGSLLQKRFTFALLTYLDDNNRKRLQHSPKNFKRPVENDSKIS
jgi:hypothetical protein